MYTHCTNILSLESVYTQSSNIWSFGIVYTHCTDFLSLESVYTQSTDILILGIVYTHCTNILSLESVYTQPSNIWSFGIVYTHCTRKLSKSCLVCWWRLNKPKASTNCALHLCLESLMSFPITWKFSMRINHKHFFYIISLPELAWKKCKQTGLWIILVDTFRLYWPKSPKSGLLCCQPPTHHFLAPSGAQGVTLSVCPPKKYQWG